MMSYLGSLREFSVRTARHVYTLLVGVIGGILGLWSVVYSAARPKAPPPVSLLLWLPLLACGLLVTIFLVFHDVRRERDEARTQVGAARESGQTEIRKIRERHETQIAEIAKARDDARTEIREVREKMQAEIHQARDSAQAEIERRFSALRYALQRGDPDFNIELAPDGTCSIELALRFTNTSDEYLRYDIEHMVVVIEGRSVANATFYNRGVIIPPHSTDKFRYPFIRAVPVDWHTGSIEFTVRYGHPSAPFRFRKSQTMKLRSSRLVGQPPPQNLRVIADLVRDPDVEDILSVGVGTWSRIVCRRLYAGPIFQSRPRAAGVVQPHGSRFGSSWDGTVFLHQPMVFKSIGDSVSTRAVTWVFSGYVHRAAHDHPVYFPCGLCGGVRVIFWPELDASAGGVEDQLSVDADPRFADPVHRPLADEPQRPGRGQRPHPPPKELRVRGAATTARLQDRPCGFRATAWPSADRLAAIGELHADREVLQLSAPAPQHLWRRVFIEAGGSRADAADYEEFESPDVGRYLDDRYRGLLGPVKVQGIDRHDARKFRLWRVPRVMHPARHRFGGW
jgi:hypothetical protein